MGRPLRGASPADAQPWRGRTRPQGASVATGRCSAYDGGVISGSRGAGTYHASGPRAGATGSRRPGTGCVHFARRVVGLCSSVSLRSTSVCRRTRRRVPCHPARRLPMSTPALPRPTPPSAVLGTPPEPQAGAPPADPLRSGAPPRIRFIAAHVGRMAGGISRAEVELRSVAGTPSCGVADVEPSATGELRATALATIEALHAVTSVRCRFALRGMQECAGVRRSRGARPARARAVRRRGGRRSAATRRGGALDGGSAAGCRVRRARRGESRALGPAHR